MKKHILSMVLTLCMLVGLLSAPVLSAEDPTLPLPKEFFVSFAFLCVVTRDGVTTASAPYAYNEAALQAPTGTGAETLAWDDAPLERKRLHCRGGLYRTCKNGQWTKSPLCRKIDYTGGFAMKKRKCTKIEGLEGGIIELRRGGENKAGDSRSGCRL